MDDPQFWSNLEKQFRALPDPSGSLRADSDYVLGSGKRDWKLTGAGYSLRVRFEALAIEAGAALEDQAGNDPLTRWLEFVFSQHPYSEFGEQSVERDRDGTTGLEHLPYMVARVCEASADQCAVLQGNARVAAESRSAEVKARVPDFLADIGRVPIAEREGAFELGKSGLYPGGISSSPWTKITPINREFIIKSVNGENLDQVICEALQKCFDALIEANLELGPTARVTPDSMNGGFANQVLEIAVAFGWLPKVMEPSSISTVHREWFLNLIRARVHYFLDAPLERVFGRDNSKPDFVVIPVPDVGPVAAAVRRTNDPTAQSTVVSNVGATKQFVKSRYQAMTSNPMNYTAERTESEIVRQLTELEESIRAGSFSGDADDLGHAACFVALEHVWRYYLCFGLAILRAGKHGPIAVTEWQAFSDAFVQNFSKTWTVQCSSTGLNLAPKVVTKYWDVFYTYIVEFANVFSLLAHEAAYCPTQSCCQTYIRRIANWELLVPFSEEILVPEADLASSELQGARQRSVPAVPPPQSGIGQKQWFDEVDAFLKRTGEAGRPIKRSDIWRVAGYTERSVFQEFQRGEANPGVIARFRAILALAPREFLAKLDEIARK